MGTTGRLGGMAEQWSFQPNFEFPRPNFVHLIFHPICSGIRTGAVKFVVDAVKGYDDMSFRELLRAEGLRPLIKHRVFAPYDHAHNARIDDDRYNQRSVYETVNSVIKRS